MADHDDAVRLAKEAVKGMHLLAAAALVEMGYTVEPPDERVLCPRCPGCGSKPAEEMTMLWPAQAFCPNDDCKAWMWAPLTPAMEQLAKSRTIDDSLFVPREEDRG